MYPDDSIQSLFNDEQLWWIKDDKYTLCRGALVYAFINHFDQHPYGFVPVGRTEAKRAGYNPELVERIRHCVYPQFFWEKLPLDTETEESILRLDQIQPIGTHYNGFKHTGYRLSEDALEIFDDWLTWLIWGGLPEDSFILSFQEELND